ncbi:tRNA (guanine-N(7)-)-methyltransferase non-catalytic subunit TRM82 [Curvularia clavata]|uniref:tRNA (Guanine-N(7)-)-methyltransferase non-catalytic subunit TRM82 n=1 Tax=Curvularia clavata TaxID=95742 RepID=A0A9Q8Z7T7_CURCL|nr:tRNA (guanine-N(7)-)-methyltransferase non-catalytic subunit TRM82 [Curvularia clavata]
MAAPFQCLIARSSQDAGDWTLFGASGSKLVVQASSGATATWPDQQAQAEEQQSSDSEERPGKRIKLEQPKEQKSNFSDLILSHNGQYLIGVTGEDKCIRVFQINPQGQLEQLSERCMSRRPSSITVTSDDTTILCADKFGDVYALPLLPSPEDYIVEQPDTPAVESEQKDWKPSATTLTVHSGRNRKTLEEQLKQKAKGIAKSKEPMRFKNELLLGHVSMLTDVAYANVDGRSYIITADRDEHIRVSRGQPQAHIIEGFCFGHEAFVSRLCLTSSGLLVSGGGDDDLFVWDWQTCSLKERLAIRDLAFGHLQERNVVAMDLDRASYKVAVSGIWALPNHGNKAEKIIVACEGIPALFGFSIGGSAPGSYVSLNGNALDVALIAGPAGSVRMVVSIDNIHKPGSTTEKREDQVPGLQCFSLQPQGSWQEDAGLAKTLEGLGRSGNTTGDDRDGQALRSMLYNIENLRKRPGADD